MSAEDKTLINETIKNNKIEDIFQSNNINYYNLIHTFQDIKYKAAIDNDFTLNNFKLNLNKNKKIFFMANEKEIPVIIKNYDTENIVSLNKEIRNILDFENFGKENNLYPSIIEEYKNNETSDIKTRKFYIKNTAVLDRNNNYIPFSSLYSMEKAELNINLSLFWNYISSTDEILISNDELFLDFLPVSEYNFSYYEYPDTQKKSIYTKENILNNLTFEFEDYKSSSLNEGDYIKNLYSDELFNENTNNSYDISDTISDNSLLINPDFFSRLGLSYKLKSFFKKSDLENNNSLNYFFALPSNETVKIIFDKRTLLNTADIEFPGEPYSKDSDSRFILSSTNSKLYTYFFKSNNQDIFENYYKIYSQSFSPPSFIENFGKKYVYEDDKQNQIEQDEVYLDPILFSTPSAFYFSNIFLSSPDNMEIKENESLYSKYRLSKAISGNLIDIPNLISHLEYINPEFESPEELYINFDLNGINSTENRIKKVLSCNYDNVNSISNLSSLNKYEIKYNIVKIFPNITNIYQVYDKNVKEIISSNLNNSNIPSSDIYKNSMLELVMHGRIYDDSSVYLCSESASAFYTKIDHFNIDSLAQSFNNIENYNPADSIKYFSDTSFNNDKISNAVIHNEIQNLYEESTFEQEKKSFFINNIIEENKGLNQKSYQDILTKDNVKDSLLYYDNSSLLIPFSVILVNKLSMKYDKYSIKSSYSSINELNQNLITHVLSENGNFYKISPIENINSNTYYKDTGEKISENIMMFLNLEKIPNNSISLEKISPLDYNLDLNSIYFNNKKSGKEENTKYRLYKNDDSSLFLFTDKKEYTSLPSNEKNNVFLNKVYSYKNKYDIDINFSSTGIDLSTESIIENSVNEDIFKLFPSERYSFFISADKFITTLPDKFSENDFNRSLIEDKFSLDLIPIEKIISKNILNPDKLEYEYLEADFSRVFYENIYNNLNFLNNNSYTKEYEENILKIRNNEALYIFPKLRTNIKSKESIALKDKFDIEIFSDFREDYLNEYIEIKENISTNNLIGKEINGKFYFNGKLYDIYDGKIEYTTKIYTPPEKPSFKKELINGKISNSKYFSFFNFDNTDYKNILPEINPIIYLNNINIHRIKQSNDSEIFFSVNLSDNDTISENTVYIKDINGNIKSDAEIINDFNKIKGLSSNFDSIEIKRIRYKISETEYKDYVYSFKISGIKFTSEIYCKYFEITSDSILQLKNTAHKNKLYKIISENSKIINTIIRKFERR